MKKITGKYALTLARHHLPTIYQGFEELVDIPCPMQFGDFKFAPRPAVYYWVRKHEAYFYIGYAFYHYRDYTKCIFGKVLKFLKGEHRHDFEGLILRVPYYLPHQTPTIPKDVITVAHHKLLYDWDTDDMVITIKSRGHAVESAQEPEKDIARLTNPILINDPLLLSYDSFSNDNIEKIRQVFNINGVNLPDQWSDEGKYEGWFYTQPHKLFEEMEDK